MQRFLRHLIVPALALAALAFAPTVGGAKIVGFETDDKGKDKDDKGKDKVVDDLLGKVDKGKDKGDDDLFGKVDKVKDDKVKGVPYTPVQTANPEASTLAMMGVVIAAATVVGLSRRARKPEA
jgi:hypothetical protein